MDDTSPTIDDVLAAVQTLAARERLRCLWFLHDEPATGGVEDALEVLRLIALRGDRSAFQEARRLATWLSPRPSASSVASSPTPA